RSPVDLNTGDFDISELDVLSMTYIFEGCRGFALERVDGGPIEDITFTGITMRDIRRNAPFFLRLGARLRGPPGTAVGTFKRVIISHIICDAPANDMPAIIAGVPGHPIENVSVSDVFMVQKGGASAACHDVAILGPGLICGRGLSRGEAAEPG